MSDFFGSVWWFLVTLGVLVTFHEFGHFWVARRFGVRVLRFSVGFGKPLWSRKGRDGVEYAIGAIPLGGYVKFLDAREADNPEYVAQQSGEFNAAPVWQRMAIAAAGPAFNILFTLIAFWAMFMLGRPDYPPVVGTPTGLAAQAGFATGDRIVAVNGEPVDSFSAVEVEIFQSAILHQDAEVDVSDAQGQPHRRKLALSTLPGEANQEPSFDAIGLLPKAPDAVIGSVVPGPAARAGLHEGDRVLRINDTPIDSFADLTKAIPLEAQKDPHLRVQIERAGSTLLLDITAESQKIDGQSPWRIGVGLADPRTAVERYDPWHAIPAAFRETWKQTKSTVHLIYSMLAGQVSAKNLSGVIGIAQAANATAHLGLAWFLTFLAIVSLSLGILNLLPIPILDGGHLVYYLIELVKGKPLSERALIASQYVGLAMLVCLMSVAFYNDILRLVAS